MPANGLFGDKDYKFAHLGAHDAVARAVQWARCGGRWTERQEIFNALVAKGSIDGKKLIVLAESDPIPNYPMVMQGNLAPELKGPDQCGLYRPEGPAIGNLPGLSSTPTDDQAYNILRDTAKVLDPRSCREFKG